MQPGKLNLVIRIFKYPKHMKTSSIVYGIILLSIASLVIQSCMPECIDGNGQYATEQRLVTPFYGVENATSFDVEVVADTFYSVEVTADDNILPLINTYVRGGNLMIDSDYSLCFNSGSVFIEIHMPSIDNIVLDGSGNMDVSNFDCSDLYIENSGSGNIDLIDIYSTATVEIENNGSGNISIMGKAITGDYDLNGSGSIYADDLLVNECYADNSGSGDIHCFAYDLLDATINGSGDIIYSGSPDVIHQDDNGSGDIRGIRN